MFFPVVTVIPGAQYRISVDHSATMELNTESRIMTEEEKKLTNGINLSDSFFLKDVIRRSRREERMEKGVKNLIGNEAISQNLFYFRNWKCLGDPTIH